MSSDYVDMLAAAMATPGAHGLPGYLKLEPIYALVAEHGREWPMGRDLSGGFDPLRPRECYANAMTTALEHRLRYVEGWGESSAVPGFWTQHAWNVTDDDLVVDRTWGSGVRYVGMVVERAEVIRLAVRYSHETPLSALARERRPAK